MREPTEPVSTWLIILLAGGAAGALVLLHGVALVKRDSQNMLDAYEQMLSDARAARLKALADAQKSKDGKADDSDVETAVAEEAQASVLSSMATAASPADQ